MRRAVLALACLAAAAPLAHASEPVRVRVSIAFPESVAAEPGFRAPSRVVGTMREWRAGRLLLTQGDRDLAIPLAAIGRIEVSEGRHPRTGRGAVIGLVGGAAGGVVAGAIVCANGNCDSSGLDNAGTYVQVALGIGGGLVGAGIGALVGSSLHTERWREVQLEQLHGRAARDGVRLALTLRGVDRPRGSTHTPGLFAPEPSPRVSLELRREV